MSVLLEERPPQAGVLGRRRETLVAPRREGSIAVHRAISLVATLGLLWPLFKAWNGIVLVPSSGIAVVALSAGALWLAGAIATADDEAKLVRLDGWLLALALLSLMAWTFLALHAQSAYGTDEAAFEQGAATLLLHGHDPYGANLISTLNQFAVPTKYATYTMNGGMVSTFGYPAFPLVVAAGFVKLTGGGQAVPIADVFALAVATVIMFRQLPAGWRGLAILVCVGLPTLGTFALSGLNTIIALPLLLIVGYRWTSTGANGTLRGGDLLRAAAFGLALATNQLAWFIAPFLVSGIYLMRRGDIGLQPARKVALHYLGVAMAAFACVNAPFFLWGPGAWLHGVLAPLTQHAVPYGQGLIDLTLFLRVGGGALDAYNYAAGFLYIALLVVYMMRFRTIGRACFVLPLAALFVSGRSLAGYWMIAMPLIAMGVLTAEQEAITAAKPMAEHWPIPQFVRRAALPALFIPVAICLGVALGTPQPLAMTILKAQSNTAEWNVEKVWVDVHNRSDEALEPHFATNAAGQPVFWQVASGPRVLRPYANALYVLWLSDAASRPLNGQPFSLEAVTPSPRTISSTRPFAQTGPVPGYW
jgi:uncharacterized membrane protein